MSAYPSLRESAKLHLNGMWKDEDYPRDIRSRYSIAIEYAPIPMAGDFRVQLSQSEIDAIAKRTEERVADGSSLFSGGN